MYNPYPNPYYNNRPSSFLPAQQIIQVNGRQSVDSIQMSPNSSVLLMDTTAPVVWMCVSDGVGRVTATPYDISRHEEKPPQSDIEQRLAAVEEAINQIKENRYGKSNVASAEPRQDIEHDTSHQESAGSRVGGTA